MNSNPCPERFYVLDAAGLPVGPRGSGASASAWFSADGLDCGRAHTFRPALPSPSQVPPRVEYELTSNGRALMPVFKAMESWAQDHMDLS
jgi:hypothetical protein